MQLEPGSKEGTIYMAEFRIRVSVQADLEKLWSERLEKEDKIITNKYETLTSQVDRLSQEIVNYGERTVATSSSGSCTNNFAVQRCVECM